MRMEHASIPGTSLSVSRVAIGTWAIGGWMWGGTDETESIATIRAALEHGINVIDTAPVYGFGRSEELVGKAIAPGSLRSRVLIATKTGLEWENGRVFRNASRTRILREVEDSLRRLRTDHIDIYQVHWPDPLVPIEETAEAMHTLFRQGKIRAIGVSNFSVAQMEAAFHPNLGIYQSADQGEFRDRESDYKIPDPLRGIVTAIIGFGEVARQLREQLRAGRAD